MCSTWQVPEHQTLKSLVGLGYGVRGLLYPSTLHQKTLKVTLYFFAEMVLQSLKDLGSLQAPLPIHDTSLLCTKLGQSEAAAHSS